MATLYAAPSGALLGFGPGDGLLPSLWTVPPEAQSVEIDPETNVAVISGLRDAWEAHRMSGGGLTRNGQPVTISAPTPLGALRTAIRDGFTDQQIKDVIVALWNGTATAAQQRKALAYLIFRCRQAGVI